MRKHGNVVLTSAITLHFLLDLRFTDDILLYLHDLGCMLPVKFWVHYWDCTMMCSHWGTTCFMVENFVYNVTEKK